MTFVCSFNDILMVIALERTIVIDVWLYVLQVLQSFKIMDYSLLIGIHNLDIANKERVCELNYMLTLSLL